MELHSLLLEHRIRMMELRIRMLDIHYSRTGSSCPCPCYSSPSDGRFYYMHRRRKEQHSLQREHRS